MGDEARTACRTLNHAEVAFNLLRLGGWGVRRRPCRPPRRHPRQANVERHERASARSVGALVGCSHSVQNVSSDLPISSGQVAFGSSRRTSRNSRTALRCSRDSAPKCSACLWCSVSVNTMPAGNLSSSSASMKAGRRNRTPSWSANVRLLSHSQRSSTGMALQSDL